MSVSTLGMSGTEKKMSALDNSLLNVCTHTDLRLGFTWLWKPQIENVVKSCPRSPVLPEGEANMSF